jgi:di/tripeptidase
MKQNLVLKYFSEICKIPNVSGNEQGIANYVSNILKQNGSQVSIDKLGNVYATKAGSLKVPGICLQAHLDMVGEKNLRLDPQLCNRSH